MPLAPFRVLAAQAEPPLDELALALAAEFKELLDLVLQRRSGLPILLSVVYIEVARRAGMDVAGVGPPGHYVAGHFGARPPILLDPFAGGHRLEVDTPAPTWLPGR